MINSASENKVLGQAFSAILKFPRPFTLTRKNEL